MIRLLHLNESTRDLIKIVYILHLRGVANGVFSWGVYLGFGLAFVLGINVTQADLFGYSWRSTYVVAGLPGIIVALLIFLTLRLYISTLNIGIQS